MTVGEYKAALTSLADALPADFSLISLDNGCWRVCSPAGNYYGDFTTPTGAVRSMIGHLWHKAEDKKEVAA